MEYGVDIFEVTKHWQHPFSIYVIITNVYLHIKSILYGFKNYPIRICGIIIGIFWIAF